MELQQVLHMSGGEGETSYAANSILQKRVMSKARPFLQKVIRDLFCNTSAHCVTMADFGCSSGPNSLLVISDVINTITALHQNSKRPLPEFKVFLNDLPGNDFNTMFKFIPHFNDQLLKVHGVVSPRCFVAGVPGSFYGSLFPKSSLSFAHSSASLHWLSQVPQGIESNKGNIYMAETSPPCVFELYQKQFDKDFTSFLRSRSMEIIPGGRMVITMVGRRSSNLKSKECVQLWELLARSLRDMIQLGLVEEDRLNTFNVPCANPSVEEITKIVEVEGSFQLDLLDTFEVNWDGNDDPENKDFVFNNVTSGKYVATTIRAATEPLLADHFGKEIIDKLFSRYAEHVGDQLMKEKVKFVNLVMAMTKKG